MRLPRRCRNSASPRHELPLVPPLSTGTCCACCGEGLSCLARPETLSAREFTSVSGERVAAQQRGEAQISVPSFARPGFGSATVPWRFLYRTCSNGLPPRASCCHPEPRVALRLPAATDMACPLGRVGEKCALNRSHENGAVGASGTQCL